MYIIRNALRNIVRSKGRNFLVGIIVLVIAVSSCVALSIRQAAATAEATGLANTQITGQITVDRTALMKQVQSGSQQDFRNSMNNAMSSVPDLSLDDLEKYASSQYVKNFFYMVTSSVNSGDDSFAPYEETDTSSAASASSGTDKNSRETDRSAMQGNGAAGKWGTQGAFSIVGYGSEDAMTSFVSGACQIETGSMIDLNAGDNTCLISDLLASCNNLTVGDTITVSNPNSSSETYSLTVCGIYTNSETASSGSSAMMFSTSSDPANRIITSAGTLNGIAAESKSAATTGTDSSGAQTTTALRSTLSGTYVFADEENFEAFKTDASAMGLSDDYTVTSSDVTAYENSLVPLKNLSSFAGTFLLVVLIVGGIVLMVLNIFNIHERKYEVGVLTAIGMKKSKVALQYVTELFVVTISCILVGAAVGAVVSVPVSNNLLASQISSQQTQSQKVEANFGRGATGGDAGTGAAASGRTTESGLRNFANLTGGGITSYVSKITASTDMTVVAQMLGIGVLLTIISSAAAVVIILRYEPLKILTSRT